MMKSIAEDKEGEEKKELDDGEGNHRVGCSSSSPVDGKDLEKEHDGSDSEDGELVDLPKELSDLLAKTYDFLDELDADLNSRGLDDLPVVIDPKSKKPRLRMTSGAHNKVVGKYIRAFDRCWGKNRWGVATGKTNIYIQAQPGRLVTRRRPDIAFWGYDKCELSKFGVLMPKDLATPPKIHETREQTACVYPDVVFHFSWKNTMGYEVEAINAIMNRALVVPEQPNHEAPTLGFLVKARTHPRKRTHDNRKILTQIDVYRIPRGATLEDAKANRNGACYAAYIPGQQDVILEVTAQDLGIKGFWARFCRSPFTISAKAIYEMLR